MGSGGATGNMPGCEAVCRHLIDSGCYSQQLDKCLMGCESGREGRIVLTEKGRRCLLAQASTE